jgi:L-alanine-DL-glutamate epimerase-like enolase superfamily enzyme
MDTKVTNVEVERVEQSLWGVFADIQSSTAFSSPMSRYAKYAASFESWCWPQAVVLVRITADTGHSGIGWAEDGVAAASNIIDRHFTRFLIGADPSQIELLWDQIFRASIPYGRKGAAIEALSAVDLALWDLKGKTLGKPVYSLLGGPVVAAPPAYASHLQPVEMDLFLQEALAYAKQGYKGMKMRMPGHPSQGTSGIRANVDRVKAVREAVGDDIDLMVDAYMGWDLAFAIRMVSALEPYRLRWIEEPLLPDEISAYTELRRRSPIPIATGEHEFTHFGFKQLIDSGAADILQPDVHRAGGITAVRRVCALASTAGLEVVPHVFSGPSAHVVCAHSNCPYVEHLTVPVWAQNKFASKPFLLGEPTVVDGKVILTGEPGFGIKINSETLPHLAHWNA